MINHIGKYNDAQAIQDALDAGQIANPYVAMTSAGTLDYNSLQPTPPAPATMGVWSDDGQGVYTFQVLDAEAIGQISQTDNVPIGNLNMVYYQGTQIDVNVELAYDGFSTWYVYFMSLGSGELDRVSFQEGTPITLSLDSFATGQDASSDYLQVDWDGVDTFVFQRNPEGSGPSISMTTIDPPYPAGE